ncbi:hypothetical protein AB3S75_017846 [Citrus x aurantiifolia]
MISIRPSKRWRLTWFPLHNSRNKAKARRTRKQEMRKTQSKMEESEVILLNSLKSGGVSIPADVSSIKDLTSETLVSICGQSLNLIFNTMTFGTSLPHSMAEKFKICTDISSAIKNLGYIGDISYYKFLYPSEEDLYKLIRFLVERLSELPKKVKVADGKGVDVRGNINKSTLEGNGETDLDHQKIRDQLEECRLENELLQSSNSEDVASDSVSSSRVQDYNKNDVTGVIRGKIKNHADNLQNRDESLMEAVTAKTSELCDPEEEYQLLKAAAEMAFDDSHPTEFYLEQLDEQVGAKKHNLVELELQWDALKESLEEKKRSLEESLYANEPEAQAKLLKLREVELEQQSVLSEIRKREDEYSKLSTDLEKQPKVASRRSYIERIKEITKNSRKVDADIERILKETRELQLESNSIQERLHRTWAVVDDMIFREAKKDQVGRQAYRLLTSIHESFEQVSEKILATDRVRREIAEYEKKLAAVASRSLNVDKLQADVDVIMKENEFLEQQFHRDG